MTRLGHDVGQASEQAVHQSAAVELALEPGFVVASGPHFAEHLHEAEQDHEVDRGDQVEKAPALPSGGRWRHRVWQARARQGRPHDGVRRKRMSRHVSETQHPRSKGSRSERIALGKTIVTERLERLGCTVKAPSSLIDGRLEVETPSGRSIEVFVSTQQVGGYVFWTSGDFSPPAPVSRPSSCWSTPKIRLCTSCRAPSG